jgi:hypothetical protein
MARAPIVLIVTTTISWILRRSCRSALCLWGISSSATGGELAMTSHVSGHAIKGITNIEVVIQRHHEPNKLA